MQTQLRVGYTCVARDMIGRQVRCLGGGPVGNIAKLVIARHTGTIHYVIVAPSALLGHGDNDLLAIPWPALSAASLRSGTRTIELPLPFDMVKRAPAFSAHAWPDFSNSREMAEVHSFYGEQPS